MLSIEVSAAGGVIVRDAPDGPELLLIHRPRYDDWSFPKGKLESGESYRDAALREVLEETGLRCQPGPALSSDVYRDARGRRKEVRYWLMEAISGSLDQRAPDQEVDGWLWATEEEARRRLTYERDRELASEAVRIYLERNT